MPQGLPSNPKFELSKLKIGVLYGGNSSERKISLRSGRAVHQALKRIGFSTRWLDPRHPEKTRKGLKQIDLAFLALHGHGGEDGKIQTELERSKVPYIGSDAPSSRRAFDKAISKKVFEKNHIPTPEWVIVSGSGWESRMKRIAGPYFLKPLREGSSIGAFAVEDLEKEAVKIRQALKRFKQLLVEKKVEGREFTVGVLENRPLPVIELKPSRSFYDYKAKYTKGMTQYDVPADIPKDLSARLQKLALKVHKVLGLRDFSRIDMMVDTLGCPYVLEANSIPGFTELSLLPKAAKSAGISFEELCYRLVQAAYKRSRKS